MLIRNRLEEYLRMIRGEFREIRDLRVTLRQAGTRWDLGHRDTELILETFVDVGFLRRTPDGSYFHPQPQSVTPDLPALPATADSG